MKMYCIPQVTTFNNTLPLLAQIIKNRRGVFQEQGVLANRRPHNLRESIEN